MDTSELHALRLPRYFTASEGLGTVAIKNHTQALTPRSNQLMAHMFYTESHYALISAGRNTNSVTETRNIDESNGTNLKPVLPILI
jgi:23S rRNA maturation mini-RNase III